MKKLVLSFILIIGLVCCHDNKKIGFMLTTDTYILDKQKPIKSLDELKGLLKGNQVYVDRWATWCSPCLEQFKYKNRLHQFLDSKNILLVYLNSDKDLTENKWIDFIKLHNLKGYHLRLNDELKTDLVKRKIFIPMIPQFMIIDKYGNVVENHALKPSDGDSLFTQIKSKLNI